MPFFTGMTKPTQNSKSETALLSNLRSRRLGCEQYIDQLIERRIRFLVNFVKLHGADGMLHDQHRMIRRAECFLLGFRQGIEGVGDQRYREPAALLNLD
jgi:hypothetical protein